MLEELRTYFETHKTEEINAKWAETEHLDNIGITCEEFIEIMQIANELYEIIKIE